MVGQVTAAIFQNVEVGAPLKMVTAIARGNVTAPMGGLEHFVIKQIVSDKSDRPRQAWLVEKLIEKNWLLKYNWLNISGKCFGFYKILSVISSIIRSKIR